MKKRIFESFGYRHYHVTFILSDYRHNCLSFVIPIWATSKKEAAYKAQCKIDKIGFMYSENTANIKVEVEKI